MHPIAKKSIKKHTFLRKYYKINGIIEIIDQSRSNLYPRKSSNLARTRNFCYLKIAAISLDESIK